MKTIKEINIPEIDISEIDAKSKEIEEKAKSAFIERLNKRRAKEEPIEKVEEKRREEWMAILRQSRLCRNLEEKELLNLMEQEGTVRTYSRGERIFQETDRPDSVYMLLNGSVIIAKETFSGKRILLAQLEDPGALFGEVYAFMEKASYDMYVEALTQVSVLIMSSRIFTDREENSLSRKLRENLLEVFAGKAYNMNRKLRILGSGSLRERIVRFLVECQDSEGQIHMNLSREEMADYLNITRPSLSRELGKMQEEGILELDRRQILVKDQEKMELYL